MRSYTVILLSLFLLTFFVSCNYHEQNEYAVPSPVFEKHTRAKTYYEIDAFNKKTKEFDRNKMFTFVNSIKGQYKNGAIISIDGLKWQKANKSFSPFPNPPIPVYEPQKELAITHVGEYKQWIIDHPHFGYPPLP